MKAKQIWRIEGFDGLKNLFATKVPAHLFSENQMEELLRRLVSKHLTEIEIVNASKNRKKERNNLLDVCRSQRSPFTISCGTNPHYLAKIVN